MALPPIEDVAPAPSPRPVLPPIEPVAPAPTQRKPSWADRMARAEGEMALRRRAYLEGLAAENPDMLTNHGNPLTAELMTLRQAPGVLRQERPDAEFELARQNEAQAAQERQDRLIEKHPVLGTPGAAGFVSALQGTKDTIQRIAGVGDREETISHGKVLQDLQAGGVRRDFGTGFWGQTTGQILNAAGGLGTDVPTMVAPGAKLASLAGKAPAALQLVLANVPYAARAFEQTLTETGDTRRAALDAAIEGLVPAVFGKTGIEAAQLQRLQQVLGTVWERGSQYLMHGAAESAEELTQELLGIVNDASHGDQMDAEQVIQRLIVATAVGGLGGTAMTAVSGEMARAADSAATSDFDRAIAEAAARDAATGQPVVQGAVLAGTPEATTMQVEQPTENVVQMLTEALATEPTEQPVDAPLPPVEDAVPVTGVDAPPAQETDAVALEQQIVQGDATYGSTPAWLAERKQLVAQKRAIDIQRAAGATGRELMTAQDRLVQAAVDKPETVPDRRARVDELAAAGQPTTKPSMKKPTPAPPPTPATTSVDLEIDRLEALARDPKTDPAVAKQAQRAVDAIYREQLGLDKSEGSNLDEPAEDTPQSREARFRERQAIGRRYTAEIDSMRLSKNQRDNLMDMVGFLRRNPDTTALDAAMAQARQTQISPTTGALPRVQPTFDATKLDEPAEDDRQLLNDQERADIRAAQDKAIQDRGGEPVPVQPAPRPEGRRAPAREGAREEQEIAQRKPEILSPAEAARLRAEHQAEKQATTFPEGTVVRESGPLTTEQPGPTGARVEPAPPAPVDPNARRGAMTEETVMPRAGAPLQAQPDTGPAQPTGEKGRAPTEAERHAAARERDEANLKASFQVRIAFPTTDAMPASTEGPKTRGETVQLAPVIEDRRLTPRRVIDASTGQETVYTPPGIYVGRITTPGSPVRGSFVVLTPTPKYFEKKAGAMPTIITQGNTPLIIPKTLSADARTQVVEMMRKLKELRAEAEAETIPSAKDEILMDAAKLDRELRTFVEGSVKATNAPYRLLYGGPEARAVDAAVATKNQQQVLRALQPYLHPTYEAAHEAALRAAEKHWTTIANADAAVPSDAQASIQEAAGSTAEGEQGNTGFGGEQGLDALVREPENLAAVEAATPEERAAGIDAAMSASRADERRAALAAYNWRRPGEVEAMIERGLTYLKNLEARDAISAWFKATANKDKDAAALGRKAVEELLLAERRGQTPILPEMDPNLARGVKDPRVSGKSDKAPPESERESRKAFIDASANPFLAEGPRSREAAQAFRELAPIDNIKRVPVPLQQALRQLQALTPGLQIAVKLGDPMQVGYRGRLEQGRKLTLVWDVDRYNGLHARTDEDERNDMVRRAFATVSHEWFHHAMRTPDISRAVLGSLKTVLGDAGVASMVADARAGWIEVEGKRIPYYQGVYQKALDGGMTEEQATTRVAEELVARALTDHIANAMFSEVAQDRKAGPWEDAVPLVKALLAAPPMGVTLDARIMLGQLGLRGGRSNIDFLAHHFANMSRWIDSIADTSATRREARQRELAQDQLGTENDLYKAGQDAPVDLSMQPEKRKVWLGKAWHANIHNLAEIAAAAVRFSSGRLVVADTVNGETTYRLVDTWLPTSVGGKAAVAELAKLGEITRGKVFANSLDEPAEDAGAEPTDFATRAKRFVETKRDDMQAKRWLGKDQTKVKGLPLSEQFGRYAGLFTHQYRELRGAKDPRSAIVAQALDRYYNRSGQAQNRAAGAMVRIGAPLLEAKRQGATQKQIDEAVDAFGDYLALRDAQEMLEAGYASGDIVKGKSRIPFTNTGDVWPDPEEAPALFSKLLEDARVRVLTNPTAYAMLQRYDAEMEAMRNEAARLGIADELNAMYFHRQVLMFHTADAKERKAKLAAALTQDTRGVRGASGQVLKSRSGGLAEYNLNPWESVQEAVSVFDRILARAELSNTIVDEVSAHNTVTKALQEKNRARALQMLDVDVDDPDVEHRGEAFKSRGEAHVRLWQMFGSLLNSDHTIADRPWLGKHTTTLEALAASWKEANGTATKARVDVVPAQAYRDLALDALNDSPPMFQQIVEQAVLGLEYLDPFDYTKAFGIAPELFPKGMIPAPVPFRPRIQGFIEEYAKGGDTYQMMLRRIAAINAQAEAMPQVVIPEHISRELGTELEAREKLRNERADSLLGTARRISVTAQLASPLTFLRYVASNVIGNTSAMAFHDPAAAAYIPAALRLLNKMYRTPGALTREERLLAKVLEDEHLLSAGLASEFREGNNNALIRQLSKLSSHQPKQPMTTALWDATWGRWSRWASPARRGVDDFARVAMFMRAIANDPQLAGAFGDTLNLSLPARAWKTATDWARGHSGLGRERMEAAKATQESARSGDTVDDLLHGRRVAAAHAAFVQGSLGNYGAVSRFGESWLGRGFVNPFIGYTDNVARQTIRALLNDLSAPSLAGKAKGAARGFLLLAAGPLLVRALNAMLNDDDDDDEEYQKFLDNPRASPWFDLYLGNWSGKPRVLGISTVLGDTLRVLGFNQIDKDIKAAIDYAGTDDLGTLRKVGQQVLGQHIAYLADPQVAYLDMVPTALGVRWNAKTASFDPVYDQTRQLLQPYGVGGLYDLARPQTGQNVGGVLAETVARPMDAEGGLIARAKAAVDRFNAAQGLTASSAKGVVDEVARQRNALRQALLRGDDETARGIVDSLYNLENRSIGPDNLLKSFGASSVYHRLGSDGVTKRTQLREKFLRWLPPEERALVEKADAIQEATFNPYRNNQLKAMLIAAADTPDLRFRTARVLANTLATEVAEARTRAATPRGPGATGPAVVVVATDLGVPQEQVMVALRLQRINRDLARATGERADRLREAYMRLAERSGIIP